VRRALSLVLAAVLAIGVRVAIVSSVRDRVAAERIRRQRKVTAFYQPFYTPMAVATFKPIAQLLRKAGLATPLADGYWRFDMKRYLDLVGKETRWNQLPGNTTYTANKSMLVASTDVRTSNSAAMYLAIASYVRNGDRVVENAAQGDRVVDQVAPLFLRQGSHLLVVAPTGLGDDRQPSGVGCGRRGGVVAAVS
jgi:hypothetical protein